MVSPSLLIHPSSSSLANSRNPVIQIEASGKLIGFVRASIAFICITTCTLLTPERPMELASICQRYNAAIACEVW